LASWHYYFYIIMTILIEEIKSIDLKKKKVEDIAHSTLSRYRLMRIGT